VGNELAGPAVGGWLFGMAAVLPFAVNAGTLRRPAFTVCCWASGPSAESRLAQARPR
jgi:hypothetical protein